MCYLTDLHVRNMKHIYGEYELELDNPNWKVHVTQPVSACFKTELKTMTFL